MKLFIYLTIFIAVINLCLSTILAQPKTPVSLIHYYYENQNVFIRT